MKWYLAKMVYRIICGEGNHAPQFDEQLRLILGEDDMEAFQKARRMGEREEDNFLNDANKPVLWKFVDIAELQPLDTLVDGVEVHSRIFEEEDARNYMKLITDKARMLHENCLHNTFQMN